MASRLGLTATRLNSLLKGNSTLQSSVRNFGPAPKAGQDNLKEAVKWEKIFIFACMPICMAMAYICNSADHHPERKEFVAYRFLTYMPREMPWGGYKTLFHNPYYNSLPDGYEEGSEELGGPGHH